ncbi:telomere length regulation protein TEL2 homolog [Phoenix dactylifera]|uniref:Telomere length regulation protein TEL2 homolog n=1 Tax=Phoenix dactylifera TaxID=42345 RepID=A0A8B9AJE1_PHODC|nr:telomere length regulation protein TEL2 homolog [Phoenix dactylifera]
MEEEKGGSGSRGRRELENLLLRKVGDVSSAIDAARHVDEVICALHSLAVLLFPVDSSRVSGVMDPRYRSQVLDVKRPTKAESNDWRHAFYHGSAFPTMSRILIYDVALNWLALFPISARKQVYDSFFVEGPPTEIVQALVPALKQSGTNRDADLNTICLNIERLLVLCLLENQGVRRVVGEFGLSYSSDEYGDELLKPDVSMFISRVAQLLASVPDKARLEALPALSSHLFFQQITKQLLVGAEERAMELFNKKDASNRNVLDGSFLFVGETFSRICRRGSTDVLLVEMIPKILDHVRSCLSSNVDPIVPDTIESKPESQFWLNMIEATKDQYAVERLSEELLRQLAIKNVSDVEAYWMLWLVFSRAFKQKAAMRAIFVDKFLHWKVFPIACLRWILQFSVFECPPNADTRMEGQKTSHFLDTVERLVNIWSRREFVQSSPMEQQAYVTAAVGLCIERMSKEELETTKDVLHSILQGVSCRLESPIDLVRKMASSIALVFSKVVDPKNPLYLDDDCETVDWGFGLLSQKKEITAASHNNETIDKFSLSKEKKRASDKKKQKDMKYETVHSDAVISDFRLVDPDEVIDPATLKGEHIWDEEEKDDESRHSETSSDSSLQPYDLLDDDTDLQKKFSQLGEIAAALRKPDDPDGVERALDVAENLVRASPDELRHNSGDLVKALVHVRCSDMTIEGEEDSAEEKRQKALVALLVTCPFESLDVLAKLLYSPNVDIGQRILIIDVMTEAAQELADSKIIRTKHQQRDLISTISGSQPWFIPSSRGPPGAGPWKEVAEPGTSLSWSHHYERELPSRPGQTKSGKSRIWSLRKAKDSQLELSKNRFPLYAAAFMLPAMQGFDKRRHGVDLLNRDFIVLGKLIYMLGVCMKCMAMHPEASALAPALLDMIRSREVSRHAEAYVRRSVVFAASCILVALHPSYVASALIEGNQEISVGLEWIRTWALHVAEADPDTECSSMAMTCLQLHAEMALQTSRALESAENYKARTCPLPSKTDNIIIPFSNMGFEF